MKKQHGYTLIEILFVVAIIAILAALVFTVAGKMSEQSKLAGCTTNLKTIAQAVHLYSVEHDNFLPTGLVRDSDKNTKQSFNSAIAPYMGNPSGDKPDAKNPQNKNPRYCPSTMVGGAEIPNEFRRDVRQWRTDYAYNQNLFPGAENVPEDASAVRFKGINFTPQTIMVYDGAQSGREPTGGGTSQHNAYARHSGKINVVFFDGHMELLKEMPTDVKYWKARQNIP